MPPEKRAKALATVACRRCSFIEEILAFVPAGQ